MSFAVAQYRQSNVETASPAQIVVKLYDGAIKFMRQGQAAIQSRELAKKGTALSKAHAIVSELQATLRSEHAPELCDSLDRLYEFVLYQITEANRQSKPELLDPAIRVLDELRSAWAEVAKQGK
jgi:flagellar protein FliS